MSEKLHKLLATAGLGSRREMEEWIRAGRVSVGGQIVGIGGRAAPEDVIRVDGRIVKFNLDSSKIRVLVFHKPEGTIVSRDDPQKRVSVFETLPRLRSNKWVAVGRLDFNTSGLLLFTTSGELANRLMHPRYEVEREYAVRIMGTLSPEQVSVLKQGVKIGGSLAKFEALVDRGGEGANHWYHVVLKEGRNREVRQIFAAVGFMVSRLIRIRYGNIKLPPRLKKGRWVELDASQVANLNKWAYSHALSNANQKETT